MSPRSPAAALRALEQASKAQHPQQAEASARFDALPSPAQKMALAREIVATRRAELTRAYGNVAMVTAGYKARTDLQGVAQIHAEPCVVFVVKRKWPAPAAGAPGQALPDRLLVYGGQGAARVLYAVPTDVQDAQWLLGGVARAQSCVDVDAVQPGLRQAGALTCAVRLRSAGGAEQAGFALSAMHVLTPVSSDPTPMKGATLRNVGPGGAVRGSSTRWGGHLDADRVSGFDVQLARISDSDWLAQAFAGVQLAPDLPYLVAPDAFDALAATMRFQILAPLNHPDHLAQSRLPMLAQFAVMAGDELAILYQLNYKGIAQRVSIRHRELIVLRVLPDCPAPDFGDSGAGVITWWPDGRAVLAGMFIASGDGPERERVAYVLPAWRLLDPAEWDRLPAGTVELVPSLA